MSHVSTRGLPEPDPSKTGFPWVPCEGHCEKAATLAPRDLPKISVVTPSFNQGCFIEETIRSVLLQNYPRCEYIVMDGGSTDATISIIERYEPWLSYWVSKPDRGQSHAINEGLSMATGDILTYINSDDVYLPGVFYSVAAAFLRNSEADFVYGRSIPVDATGIRKEYFFPTRPYSRWRLLYLHNYLSQPATFWRRQTWRELGAFDESLHLVMDYDYWIRGAKASKVFLSLPDPLVRFRYHTSAKTTFAGRASQHTELRYVFKTHNLPSSTHALYEVLLAPISQKYAEFRYAYRQKGLFSLFHFLCSLVLKTCRKWSRTLKQSS